MLSLNRFIGLGRRASRARIAALAGVVTLLVAGTASAQDKPIVPPGKMPPGMTPEIMKMMITPGPPNPAGLPHGLVPVDGCIPAMGFHYVKPGGFPFGPIYGWYKNKPIFTEIMVSKKAFDKGSNWDEQLKPLPGYHIDHVDIWFEPQGHPGYTQPHYDIHAWYIPHHDHMTFCGNTSGKRPVFV